jgi:hypothetical protein
MSSTITKAWSKSHPSPWRRLKAHPAKSKEKGASDWPELKRDKKSLQVEGEGENIWGKVPPLPQNDIPQRSCSVRLEESARNGQIVLLDLESMLKEEDEPDFKHKPTDDAYKLARKTLKSAYTHFVGSAPLPAIAPDGGGGLIVEWESGEREVRLISAYNKEHKSYMYSRGAKIAKIDYEVSGLILAQVLRSTFTE